MASQLVCEYCKCPQGSGRVDPGCPPQNMACTGCPVAFTPAPYGTPSTDIDQGVLDFMNYALPGCGVNRDIARVAKQTGIFKTLPLGQQCPAGYMFTERPLEKANSPLNTLNTWCARISPSDGDRAIIGPYIQPINLCALNTLRSPDASTPAQAPTPVPAPVPGPALKSELPMWAIILIVIAAFLVVGGLVYAGIKMSQ